MAGEEVLGGTLAGTDMLAGLTAGLILVFILWMAAIYVYFALAFQSIARKSGYKRPWFAWIPILNVVMILELGGFHWAWIFLYAGSMIPLVGMIPAIALAVLALISIWRIFEKAGYSGALSLLFLVPIARMIVLGIVAWEKKSYKKAVPAVKKKAVKKVVAKKTTAKKKK